MKSCRSAQVGGGVGDPTDMRRSRRARRSDDVFLIRRTEHDWKARPIPATRQQSDNARRRIERRAADHRASNERWRSILAGATEVFRREGGFARARLEDVAAEVGINRASLYYYVGTKEELLIALVEEPAREMTRHCREALDSDGPADVKLRTALHCFFVEDLQKYPELFLLFSESQHIAGIPDAEASAGTPRTTWTPCLPSSKRA